MKKLTTAFLAIASLTACASIGAPTNFSPSQLEVQRQLRLKAVERPVSKRVSEAAEAQRLEGIQTVFSPD